ncbi:MAG: hypothetical protein LBM70_06880 [Victivallales bacterium]|jgi:putative flippase GtrA|nr:hypothetical protein [Victivallales bacterium]
MISRSRIFELIRYVGGCGCGILVKMASTSIFLFLGWTVDFAYLGAQVVILFFAYMYHSHITFRRKLNGFKAHVKGFFVFAGSVMVFKLLDYFLVVVGAKYLAKRLEQNEDLSMWLKQAIVMCMIPAVSVMIFAIRYFVYRIVFKSKTGEEEIV